MSKPLKYICPVCGWDQLDEVPNSSFEICDCCYVEFGYEDTGRTHEELRREWIADGMPWRGENVTPPPSGWNPEEQLKNVVK